MTTTTTTTTPARQQFAKQQYFNLETFRKSGAGIKTPVWFAEDPDTGVYYVMTIKTAGKAKRIRNNPQVNIAPCKADGTPLGDWFPATARELTDPAATHRANATLSRKYGLMKTMFMTMGRLRGSQYTFLEVTLASSEG